MELWSVKMGVLKVFGKRVKVAQAISTPVVTI